MKDNYMQQNQFGIRSTLVGNDKQPIRRGGLNREFLLKSQKIKRKWELPGRRH